MAHTTGRFKDLFASGMTYAGSSAVAQLVMFGAWSFLPWAIDASVLGTFALLSFVADLLARFAILGVDAAVVRYYGDTERRHGIVRSAWLWLAIGLGVGLTGAWLTRGVVPQLLPGLAREYANAYGFVWFLAASNAIASLVLAHRMAARDAKGFGRLSVLKSLVTAAGFVAAGVAGWGAVGLLAAQALGAASVTGTALATGGVRIDPRAPSRADMADVASYGLPLTLYAAVSLVSDYAGRLMLDRLGVAATLGIFQFYLQIATQVNGLWASLNRAWSPHVFAGLVRDRAGTIAEVTRMSTLLPAIYAACVAVLLLASATGVQGLLLPAEYAARFDLFAVLLLGPLYTSLYLATYPLFYADRDTVRVSGVQSALSIVTMILTATLAARFGAFGAAAGWVLGAMMAPFFYLLSSPSLLQELRLVALTCIAWSVAGIAAGGVLALTGSAPWAGVVVGVGALCGLGWGRATEYFRGGSRELAKPSP
ncbi:MAG: hypothetical protein FJ202_06760 [Gemmatimonadetes bacterium]|nr:hypothetical protein [Gemmatimonadota bacterium]